MEQEENSAASLADTPATESQAQSAHESQELDTNEPQAQSSDAVAAGESAESPDTAPLRDRVIAVLKTIYDPEIPVDIYEMGLIYGVDVYQECNIQITMTLTTPMCPVAETLPLEIEDKVRRLEEVGVVDLNLVWDPPWNPDMMSEAAKLELNF